MNFTNFQLNSIFFKTSPKSSNVTTLVTKWVKCKEPVSINASMSVREPSSVEYLCVTIPLGVKTIAHLSVHLAWSYRLDLMSKLTTCSRLDQQSSRAGYGPRAKLCRPLVYLKGKRA